MTSGKESERAMTNGIRYDEEAIMFGFGWAPGGGNESWLYFLYGQLR